MASELDQVRLMVGDTDMSDPLLSDEEVGVFLTDRSITVDGTTTANVIAAAADAAQAIAAKFARDYTFSEDGQSFNRAERVNHYRTLSESLRRRQGGQSIPLTTDAVTG